MAGIQVCYAAQINLGTSELLLLGLSERSVSLAWLAGPLSGLIVQPIVGHLSDFCASPLGRRRPFLIAGTVFTAAALLLFSHARYVASVLGAGAGGALAIAVASFFLLDFSIQAIQAPLRALVTDVVPQPQRAFANAYIGVFTGVGNLVGGMLAAVKLSVIVPLFSRDTQALFVAAAIILVITVTASVVATPEIPLISNGYERIDMRVEPPEAPSWRGFLDSLRGIPRPFWQVFSVQLCTWCGFFTLFVYVNTWVGRDIYGGDGSAAAGSHSREIFERGVRLGGKGNALTAFMTLGYSLLLPKILARFGVLKTYAFSQVVEAGCLLTAPLLHVRNGELPGWGLRFATMLDIGLFGVVWATTMGVPWTLIGDALEKDARYSGKIGLFTTVFNASQSFPQLIVAFMAPFVLGIAGEDPAAVMFVGGIAALVGGVLVYWLRVDVGQDFERDVGE